MIRALAFAAALLAIAPAHAEQLTPEQAAAATLGQQYGVALYENGRLATQLQQAQAQLAAAQAQIKELQAKPAKEDKPKE